MSTKRHKLTKNCRTTIKFGQKYSDAVRKQIKKQFGYDLPSKSNYWEVAPPRGQVATFYAPCKIKIKSKQLNHPSAGNRITFRPLIPNGKWLFHRFGLNHLGRIANLTINKNYPAGTILGWVGGKYGQSGIGTGPHVAIEDKRFGKHLDPKKEVQRIWKYLKKIEKKS